MSAASEQVAEGAAAEQIRESMLRVLERQRESFLAEGPVSAETRIGRIDRAVELLVDNRQALVEAVSEDFGNRPLPMSLMTEIMSSVKPLKHARRHVKRWMKPEKRKLDFPLWLLGAKARVHFQPKGVIGCISPWNFPISLSFTPMAGMFAAGNRVMLKPSEYTPATSELMKTLAEKYFDETELAVFTGGPEVGKAFSSLPFDHLMFTGATEIGRHVMRAAAENLVPVTLELGGKSPVIVGRSADVGDAAGKIMLGKLMNAGQICLAPDYLMVPAERKDELMTAMEKATAEMYPKLRDNPDYTSVINERNAERLRGYVAEARERGAKVVELNPANEDLGGQEAARTMPPVLVEDAGDDLKVMQEEIFGPVLPVRTYERIDEAIDYVNAHPRPLGLYYFGSDGEEEARVLAETTSGGVTLNDVIWHVGQEDLPFGGIGPSGMGAYHGIDGFREFSHRKSVFRQAKVNLARLIGMVPPYGEKLDKTLAREIKK